MIGTVPWLALSHWPTVPIKHVARLGTGHTPSRQEPEYWLDCTIPWVTLADVWQLRDGRTRVIRETAEKISTVGLANSAAVRHSERSVILSRTASVGFSAIMAVDMATSQDFAVWTCGPRMLPEFLLHVLRAMEPDLKRLAAGSTHKTIYMPDIGQLRTPLPPVSDQRRIAAYLDAETARIDRLIELRHAQLRSLEAMEVASIRSGVSGASFTDKPRQSEVSWVGPVHPAAHLLPLARLLTLQRGSDLTEDERRDGPVPVLTSGGIVGTHNRAIVDGPGVVIARYGSVGKVFWVDGNYWPHNTTLFVKNFMGNVPRYVYYLLRSYPYEMLQARSAVPGINRNDMSPDLMPCLPLALQAQCVEHLDEKLSVQKAAHNALVRSVSLLVERRQAVTMAAVTGLLDLTTTRGAA
jgi:type I restriction enzyme S subunit